MAQTPTCTPPETSATDLTAAGVLLEVRDLSKSFAGVPALTDVHLTLRRGAVHAVVGHNGAGKSTLMKIISGVQAPSGGVMVLDGEETHFASPRDAHARGVSMVHQELSILEDLTIAENIFLGREPRTRAGLVDRRAMAKAAAEVLASPPSRFADPFGLPRPQCRRATDGGDRARHLARMQGADTR